MTKRVTLPARVHRARRAAGAPLSVALLASRQAHQAHPRPTTTTDASSLGSALAGGGLTLAGIALLVLPRPALVVMAAGVLLLAKRFARVLHAVARLTPVLPRAVSVALTSALETRDRR